MVNFLKLVADFPLQTSFGIRLRAFWFGPGYDLTDDPPTDGKITVEFETYLGGAMSHVDYDFVNTGGTVQETVSIEVQLYTDAVGADVDGDEAGTLIYNPVTKQAAIVPAAPSTPPMSSAVNSRHAMLARSAATKS